MSGFILCVEDTAVNTKGGDRKKEKKYLSLLTKLYVIRKGGDN